MSWQDDPIVDQPSTPSQTSSTQSQPWESDPVVDAPGKIESFSRGAANNFPLLPQAIAGGESIFNDKGYSKNLSDWNANAQAAKEANPKTYGAGAVTGAVAPLLIPGVGEAMEAAPLAANATYGAASAISNKDLTKDAVGTVKDAAMGAGTGAAVGGLGKLVGAGANALGNAGSRLEANATANALDLGTFGVRKLAKEIGGNPETVLTDINKKINTLMPDLIGYGDTAASKYQKLLDANKATSGIIGKVIDSTSDELGTALPEAQEAIEELDKAASKFNGLTSARNADAKAELLDAKTQLEALQKEGSLNFQNLYEVKKGIGAAYHNPNLDNPGIDKAYGILADKIDSVLKRATVSDPAVKASFDKAKDIFKFTSNVLPAMQRGVSREVAGTGGGLSSAALGAGAIFGHPLAAAAGFVGKTAAKLAAPELAPNLAYKAINAAKNSGAKLPAQTPQAIEQAINDYFSSKPEYTDIFQKAANQ